MKLPFGQNPVMSYRRLLFLEIMICEPTFIFDRLFKEQTHLELTFGFADSSCVRRWSESIIPHGLLHVNRQTICGIFLALKCWILLSFIRNDEIHRRTIGLVNLHSDSHEWQIKWWTSSPGRLVNLDPNEYLSGRMWLIPIGIGKESGWLNRASQ